MNSKERCLAVIRGDKPDRVPIFPLTMFLPADRLGVSCREYATNGSVMAAGQILVAEMFDVDAVTGCSDAYRVAADLGAAGTAYKGNLNLTEDFVYADPAHCAARARECMEQARGTRYMLSGGCEVPAATTDEVFRAFCEVPKNAAS